MANVMKPGQGDTVSIRSIPTSEKDRSEYKKAFREQKEIEQRHKEERFAKIAEQRKGRGRGGRGINIEVS